MMGEYSDSDDEREAESVALIGAPAYNLDSWTVGRGGPQCSQSGEFCYFCAFDNPNLVPNNDKKQAFNDDLSALWDIVEVLMEQKKELPIIVNTVFNIYNKHVRQHVKYEHPDTGQIISKPMWSKQSIKSHLLFSNNYPQLFDNVVDHIFQSIIYRQNNTVMDASNNTVIEERRVSLMDTINNFSKWKTSQHKICGKSRAGKQKALPPPRLLKENKTVITGGDDSI